MVGFRLQEAVADVPVEAPPSQDEAEIRSLMFDMKVSLSHGKKYEPPPRSDMPPLPMHQYEYEVRVAFFYSFLFLRRRLFFFLSFFYVVCGFCV